MDQKVFSSFREIIYSASGINLTDEKVHLLSNRIFRRMRELKLEDPGDYLETVMIDKSGEELIVLLNAISTNVTHFYREPEHFETLAKILQGYKDVHKKKLRIWCAASSTGEEPYTIGVTVAEVLGFAEIDFKLLATDINIDVLRKAKAGVYQEKHLERFPKHLIPKYFLKHKQGSDVHYQIKPELAASVAFCRLNLVEFPYRIKGPADIVFCRNVLIYFDLETRQRVISEVDRVLSPGGYLFLSRSENLLGIKHNFESLSGSLFQKRG